MRAINGKYNFALIMCDDLEESAEVQIKNILDKNIFKDCQIRVMADVHAGKGCVVGLTISSNKYIVPNLIGVDGSCGLLSYNLGKINPDFEGLDDYIKTNIPSGFSVNPKPYHIIEKLKHTYLSLANKVYKEDKGSVEKVWLSCGSLGGGNHFVALNQDPEDNVWLTVHSGSRNFGLTTCNYHQNKAKELMRVFKIEDEYDEVEFLPIGYGAEEYLSDMTAIGSYAYLNRLSICCRIINEFFNISPVHELEHIHTVHNFVDHDGTIRKGAISAHEGERLLIPISMKDGVIVGVGKGSKKWNSSAPHGAGRIMGRKVAKNTLSLDKFKSEMQGVWSSCVDADRLDESPMAYKTKEHILNA